MKEKLSKEDIKVLEFLSKYKLLKVEDARLIYKTNRYYRKRINNLIDKKYVKRYKSYIMLDKNGRKEVNMIRKSYIKNIKNEAFMERLKNIARLATISIDSNVKFIPSWDMKEKNIYTETARKYLGKLKMENKEYLVYYISASKKHIYIKQLLFDIKKATNYNDIIIFVDKLDVINSKYSNMVFGKENTYIILNSNENKEIIKKYENINFHELLEIIYEEEIMISNWELADYLLQDGTYIVNMLFINTEKLEKINWYYDENTNINKKIEIITLEENEEKIKEILNNKCLIRTFDKNLLGGINEAKEFNPDIM